MIYVVEDDKSIRELVAYAMDSAGFETVCCNSAAEFFSRLDPSKAQLAILDIMLPGEDGYSILEKLKSTEATRDIPVIMVTAKEAEYDKVRGLEGGADDYITKPFGMMEFIARVKAVLRRSRKHTGEKEFCYKGLKVNVERRQVWDRDRNVELTLKEFELLRYLIENQGIVLSRNQILEKIWGYEFAGETRTVDVHIRRLREKIEANPSKPVSLVTAKGLGYRLNLKGAKS